MRVTISHREETRGMLKKTKLCAVEVSVQFSEEEKQIIDMWDLGGFIVVERRSPADLEVNEEIGYPLRISHLLSGKETYVVGTPHMAKIFHEELKESLENLKEFITANAGIENKSETFEL